MEALVHAEGSWKVQLDCNGVDDFADFEGSNPSGLQACDRLEVSCGEEYLITNLEAQVSPAGICISRLPLLS